jgi:hypothetical protein
VQTEGSDSEQLEHGNKPKNPSGSSKQKISAAKAEKNRPKSSSRGRKIDAKSFKCESSKIPNGGWFHATTAGLNTDSSQRPVDTTESSSASSSADEEKLSNFQRNLRRA